MRYHLATMLAVVAIFSFVMAAALSSPGWLVLPILGLLCSPLLAVWCYEREPALPRRRRPAGVRPPGAAPDFPRIGPYM